MGSWLVDRLQGLAQRSSTWTSLHISYEPRHESWSLTGHEIGVSQCGVGQELVKVPLVRDRGKRIALI
jgi:hypothetical protein